MNWFLLYALLALCVCLIFNGLLHKGKIYEFPFLAGLTFFGFALPQLPAYADDPYLPEGAFAKTVFFTIVCAAMCVIGWRAGKRPFSGLRWTFDERCLLWVAAILSLIGAFFYYKVSRLPDEVRLYITTGLPVAYLFFSRLHYYGSIIAVLCFARRPSGLALSIILFDLVFFFDRIVIAGRRSEAMDFMMLIGLAAWFYRRYVPPRLLVLAFVLFFPLAIASTGDYRAVSFSDGDPPKLEEVANIDVVGNFLELIRIGGLEMRNAMYKIDTIDRNLALDYGFFNWNTLVFNFVPAQLVGADIKDSLYISLPWFSEQNPVGYEPHTGSTWTGMGDAFASFWYFGGLKFFLFSYLLARIYRSAMEGEFVWQVIYMLSVGNAMLMITHHTQQVLWTWGHAALLLVPFLALVREKASRRGPALSQRAPSFATGARHTNASGPPPRSR